MRTPPPVLPRELRQCWDTPYYVGVDGSVWSFTRGAPHRMKPEPHYRTGHPRVRLHVGAPPRHRWFFVHALVAAFYIGPRPSGLLIRHLDGDPTNASPENLAYGDRYENAEDLVRHRAERARQGWADAGQQALPPEPPDDDPCPF